MTSATGTGGVEVKTLEPPLRAGVVLVMSRLLLISQAVGAALRGRGNAAETMGWAEAVHRATEDLTESDEVLLLDDLEGRDAIEAAQFLIAESAAQVLVLTPSTEGAAWGAMLASGAAGVMAADSSFVEVESALRRIREGASLCSEVTQAQLMGEWFHWRAEDDAVRQRLAALSPREREILDRLSVGSCVGEIVTDLGVAETTVRSHIRSVRRKLEVGSQLAAVAVVHRLEGTVEGTIDAPRPLLPPTLAPTLPSPRRPES